MVLEYYLGCSGWSYDGWKGHFYPKELDNKYWLSYYSQIFDFVEIDSTFYKTPSTFMVNNWNKRTPDNFKFAVKFPKVITHDKRLKDVDKDIENFYDAMEPLHEKIIVLLFQLPPSLQITEGLDMLKNLDYIYHLNLDWKRKGKFDNPSKKELLNGVTFVYNSCLSL